MRGNTIVIQKGKKQTENICKIRKKKKREKERRKIEKIPQKYPTNRMKNINKNVWKKKPKIPKRKITIQIVRKLKTENNKIELKSN